MILSSTYIGLAGISLEIAGFILILVTVKPIPHSSQSDFVTGYEHIRNVVTNTHANWYYVGISAVIAGLVCQGISLVI